MGFTTGDFPPVDPVTFMDETYQERTKILSRHWAEYGFGTPKMVALIYIVKVLVLHVAIGVTLVTVTTGYSPFDTSEWWNQPIIWQKFVLWTMLLEALGIAGSWGPLAGHFKPMMGGALYYLKKGTVRNPPWPDKVPNTAGTYRETIDVALYAGFITCLVLGLVWKGTGVEGGEHGLISPVILIAGLLFLLALGLRDKISALQARWEQYAPAMFFFAVYPITDMLVAGKLLIVVVWVGAAFSKLGHHFVNVIPPMVSNTPWLPSKTIKRMHYRDFPEDMRPSPYGIRFTHAMGTAVEAGFPIVLLFSHNHTITAIAAVGMIGFHMFIISTFPLAVPLEWNVLFAYLAGFLFLGPGQDLHLSDMGTGWLLLTLVITMTGPIWGNLRPDQVSFLPSMRQYAGNWASAMWAFAPGAEEKLNEHIIKPALMQKQQLIPLYGELESEVIMQQLLGWRSMHSQGRGMNSVMWNTLGDDINHYTLREAEFSCNAITGFNFGDGHFHNEYMLNGLQDRCNFKPGEFVVVWVESEVFTTDRQDYWVWDAAEGIIERGSWKVTDCVAEQPWLPNGPVATNVTWRKEGYQRVRYPKAPPNPNPVPAPGSDKEQVPA
jgi:hypothetical protein